MLRCALVEEVPDDVDMNFGREGETLGRASGRAHRPMSDQDRRVCGDHETFVANGGFGIATLERESDAQACRAAYDRRHAGLHAIGRVERCSYGGEIPLHEGRVE